LFECSFTQPPLLREACGLTALHTGEAEIDSPDFGLDGLSADQAVVGPEIMESIEPAGFAHHITSLY